MDVLSLFSSVQNSKGQAVVAALLLAFSLHQVLSCSKPRRTAKIPPKSERVLVIGASSGIGRSIARQYAKRGARVCVVGRRAPLLLEVAGECRALGPLRPDIPANHLLAFPADFNDVDSMVKLRELIQIEWDGLDTLVVVAGVSALQPLLAVAGVDSQRTKDPSSHATAEGIQRAADVASAAIRGNYIGPLVTAVTFIPMLEDTSAAPSVLLVNSLASVIPAPTRTIYASTKSASLLLYQALSIEHPKITFSQILPSTVEGDFRASAVDSGPVREADPNKHGLKREDVAARCIQAADKQEKTVFMPGLMRYAHILYWLWPSFIERKARQKYNFTS